ncbi:MAG: Phosphate ABC transporter, periplasmic phosphate-binding protein PstS [Firmicutes bacterium]|nr:Phosphate ABC transporter, periplasmic phosphate-binding protein PstS [Bacillota bacterium]MDI6706541.1 phosphate ABC transporter substrate-binding protein [Bacillota bacterium]
MKKLFTISILVIALALVLIGCQKAAEPAEPSSGSQNEVLSGNITIAGSTSVQPLAEQLAQIFMEKNQGVRIDVQGGGSSVGVQSAHEGVADIGTSSRELKNEEKPYNLKEFVIAKDGIAVIVNSGNQAVSELTLEQVKKIFTGQVTNWKEVGGADAKITVVNREEGSGTRGAFEEIVLGKDKFVENAIIQPSTGAVKQTVSTDPNAIGYISMGSLDNSVKGVKVEGAEPTSENVVNGSYKISRPFLMLTKEEPQGAVKAFLDFIFSPEGQNIVGQEFIKVR